MRPGFRAIEPSRAMVYFVLRIDEDSIADHAREVPGSKEAQIYIEHEDGSYEWDHRKLLELESEAYREVKQLFRAIGFRVSDEGHVHNDLSLKFGVESWADVHRLLHWLSSRGMEGDEEFVLETSPFVFFGDFRLYPDFDAEDRVEGMSDLKDWVRLLRPKATGRLRETSLERGSRRAYVLAEFPDDTVLCRVCDEKNLWSRLEQHDLLPDEKKHQIWLSLETSDGKELGSVDFSHHGFFTGSGQGVLWPIEVWFSKDASEMQRENSIRKMTWFFLSTIPKSALQEVDQLDQVVADLNLPRRLPATTAGMTHDLYLPQDMAKMLQGVIEKSAQNMVRFKADGNVYFFFDEQISMDPDSGKISPDWMVSAPYSFEEEGPGFYFVVNNEDMVIGIGQSPRAALENIPFFVWPGKEEEWLAQHLFPGKLVHQEAIELSLLLDEIPFLYRPEEEFEAFLQGG